MKFLYVKDKAAANQMWESGYPLLKQTDTGIWVFLNIYEDKKEFDKKSEVIPMDKITF